MRVTCRCGVTLVENRRGPGICLPCEYKRKARWRARMRLLPTKEFPGVDIDAIHYKLGAVRK